MRCVGMTLAVLAAVWACPAAAQKLQAEYNAAQAAFDKGDYATAASQFEQLLAKMPAKQAAGRSAAQIRVLLGEAQLALGQRSGAIDSFERALPTFSGDTAEDRRERTTLHYDIGRAYVGMHDYDAARRHIEKAIAEGGYVDDRKSAVSLQVALARVTTFIAPDVARRALDAVMPDVEVLLKDQRDKIGEIYSLRGRIELNHGQPALAREWFEKALKIAGGLTMRVSVADTRIRSDLALAHYLLGDEDRARKYLAYTGAGHLPNGGLDDGVDMDLPNCAANDIRPEDMVVIDFAIGDDGRVLAEAPIYSTRPGQIEAVFARQVAQWSWTPEAAAKLKPFWRQSIRLELRCSNEPERPSLMQGFRQAFDLWLRGKSVKPFEAGEASEAAAAAKLKAELARRETAFGPSSTQLLPILLGLAENRTIDAEATGAIMARLLPIAEAAGAPLELRIPLELAFPGSHRKSSGRDATSEMLRRLQADGKGETRAAALVRIALGQQHEQQRNREEAARYYREVVALPTDAVGTADPLRQLALLRLASLSAAAKQFAEASRLLAETGLRPDQCALVDVAPIATNTSIGANDFPKEARRWGFEGWVRVSYDIDADGKPIAPRTIVAYPPLIFGPATEKAISRFRYQPIYREGNAVGCSGYVQPVNYRYVD